MKNNQDLYSNRISRANLFAISIGAIIGTSMRLFLIVENQSFSILNIIPINILGSFIYAFISQFENIIPKNLKIFALSGFCASFTTFSTTIAQANISLNLGNYKSFFLAILGNFTMTLIFSIFAIIICNKAFKKLRRAK